MRARGATIIGLSLCLVCAAPAMAQAPAQTTTPPACEVPAFLLTTENPLPKVAAAIKAGKLDVLVIGSRSSTITAPDGTAYPGRLESLLRQKLPNVKINVAVDLQPKKSAAEVASEFEKMMAARQPTLVIWQTGTVDAMRSIDPDEFGSSIDEGIATLQKAGADVVLMNLQYSPRTDSVISPAPYVDSMRVTAQERGVPVFDRFAIMRHWSDAGDFDLFNPSPGLDLAKQVHDCLGRSLTTFVLDAARAADAPPVQKG